MNPANRLLLAALFGSAASVHAASLSFTSLTRMTNNGTSFNLSVFDGSASYKPNIDTGSDAIVTLGDGTLLDWKLLGGSNLNNMALNSNNVGYSNGSASYINNPTSTAPDGSAGLIYSPYSWGQVWTTTDPGVNFSSAANQTTFTVLNAGANTNPIGPITGTVNITTLLSGQFYIFAGGYQANTDYILSLSGPGQTTLNAAHNNAINANNNRVNSVLFTFDNADGLYDTLTWTYKHNASNIRGRFMGVAIDGVVAPVPEPSTAFLAALGAMALLRRRRAS